MTKTELIVGVFIALLTIAVALFLAYSADNKGYVSDDDWERSQHEEDDDDERR